DRMLHLDTGVHLDEEELTVLVEKLEGAGAAVTQLDTGLYAAGLDFGTGLLVNARGRRFLDDLLVAALQRAVPIAQMNGIALTVLVEKLEGAGAAVTQLDTGLYAAGLDFGTGLLVNARGRRFLDDLLVAALQRAVPIAQMNGIALTVGQHLNFHVTGIGQELL